MESSGASSTPSLSGTTPKSSSGELDYIQQIQDAFGSDSSSGVVAQVCQTETSVSPVATSDDVIRALWLLWHQMPSTSNEAKRLLEFLKSINVSELQSATHLLKLKTRLTLEFMGMIRNHSNEIKNLIEAIRTENLLHHPCLMEVVETISIKLSHLRESVITLNMVSRSALEHPLQLQPATRFLKEGLYHDFHKENPAFMALIFEVSGQRWSSSQTEIMQTILPIYRRRERILNLLQNRFSKKSQLWLIVRILSQRLVRFHESGQHEIEQVLQGLTSKYAHISVQDLERILVRMLAVMANVPVPSEHTDRLLKFRRTLNGSLAQVMTTSLWELVETTLLTNILSLSSNDQNSIMTCDEIHMVDLLIARELGLPTEQSLETINRRFRVLLLENLPVWMFERNFENITLVGTHCDVCRCLQASKSSTASTFMGQVFSILRLSSSQKTHDQKIFLQWLISLLKSEDENDIEARTVWMEERLKNLVKFRMEKGFDHTGVIVRFFGIFILMASETAMRFLETYSTSLEISHSASACPFGQDFSFTGLLRSAYSTTQTDDAVRTMLGQACTLVGTSIKECLKKGKTLQNFWKNMGDAVKIFDKDASILLTSVGEFENAQISEETESVNLMINARKIPGLFKKIKDTRERLWDLERDQRERTNGKAERKKGSSALSARKVMRATATRTEDTQRVLESETCEMNACRETIRETISTIRNTLKNVVIEGRYSQVLSELCTLGNELITEIDSSVDQMVASVSIASPITLELLRLFLGELMTCQTQKLFCVEFVELHVNQLKCILQTGCLVSSFEQKTSCASRSLIDTLMQDMITLLCGMALSVYPAENVREIVLLDLNRLASDESWIVKRCRFLQRVHQMELVGSIVERYSLDTRAFSMSTLCHQINMIDPITITVIADASDAPESHHTEAGEDEDEATETQSETETSTEALFNTSDLGALVFKILSPSQKKSIHSERRFSLRFLTFFQEQVAKAKKTHTVRRSSEKKQSIREILTDGQETPVCEVISSSSIDLSVKQIEPETVSHVDRDIPESGLQGGGGGVADTHDSEDDDEDDEDDDFDDDEDDLEDDENDFQMSSPGLRKRPIRAPVPLSQLEQMRRQRALIEEMMTLISKTISGNIDVINRLTRTSLCEMRFDALPMNIEALMKTASADCWIEILIAELIRNQMQKNVSDPNVIARFIRQTVNRCFTAKPRWNLNNVQEAETDETETASADVDETETASTDVAVAPFTIPAPTPENTKKSPRRTSKTGKKKPVK
jgi:hypothetical protein